MENTKKTAWKTFYLGDKRVSGYPLEDENIGDEEDTYSEICRIHLVDPESITVKLEEF
jgi:hypothetical protein